MAYSRFHVVHPAALQDPAALFYVAAILARRVDEANRTFVQLTNEIQEKPRGVIDLTIKKMQRLLGASGQTFAYAGLSYRGYARRLVAGAPGHGRWVPFK